MSNKPKSTLGSWLTFLFRRQLPLESETTVFILVNACDIYMTWILLSRGGFVESNPIARFFLDHWGQKGFVGFKFAVVAFVCVLTQIIALKRVDVARRVLQLGTLVVMIVVIYSAMLLFRHGLAQ